MSPLSLLLNVLWIVFGGLWMAVGWVIAAVIMAITIIGLPWTRAAFNIAVYTVLPFGFKRRCRATNTVGFVSDLGNGPSGLHRQYHLAGAGGLVARTRGICLTALLLAVTIIGIPFRVGSPKVGGHCPGAHRQDDCAGHSTLD